MKLKSVQRLTAWLLLAAILILGVSGWGITRTDIIYRASFHLINRGLADAIHRYLQVPTALIFIAHVLINVRLNLPRRRKTWVTDTILIALGIILLGIVIYVEGR